MKSEVVERKGKEKKRGSVVVVACEADLSVEFLLQVWINAL